MRAPDPVSRPAHGGDLDSIAKRYGVEASSLLDFSSNVDPYGPPSRVKAVLYETARYNPELLARYPEPTSAALRDALGKRHGVDSANVVVANGSAAIFDAVARAIAPKATVVPVPAFSEYRRAVESAGSEYVAHPLDAQFDFDDGELLRQVEQMDSKMLILTNPHNPSGKVFERERLLALIRACAAVDTFVVIDEAFVDYVEDRSLVADVPENAIVVRSLTKFFGIAGIRVGYAVATAQLAKSIASRLPSWPIGALDQAAALAILNFQQGYASRTINRNRTERRRFVKGLVPAGITVFPSEANFFLLELPCRPEEMDEWLARLVRDYGIVVRDCRTYEGLENRSTIRVAVRKQDENTRLFDALCALAGEDA
jgi:threonine-phosphate decarboxylase